jgi:hypothetical protein
MITGPMCKAARALVEITRSKLATAAGVDEAVIEAFERQITIPEPAIVDALQSALEKLGASFIPEQGSNGAGVRLKFSRSVTRRLAALENEGGPTATDEVP